MMICVLKKIFSLLQMYQQTACELCSFKFLKIRFVVFSVFVLSSTSGCDYIDSRSFKTAMEQKNCEDAKNILLRTLKRDRNNKEAEYNLVHAFACAGDFISAQKQVDTALLNESPYIYELNFLKGYILGEMGDVDEALMAYQKALEINPDIRIKQNMELLLKDQQSGKSGKKKKGKNKDKSSESDKNSDEGDKNKDEENKKSNADQKNKQDPKENQSKKMTQKQIEKIMKEIDGDEKKIRSQGLKVKSKKGGPSNEKNW